jgi:hypothetical protein
MRTLCGFLLVAAYAAGCGAPSTGEPPAAATPPPAAAHPSDHAHTETQHAPDPAAEVLLPPDMPNRETDPVAFWTWRVDQMFKNYDIDKNGKIARDEFSGDPAEFAAMDVDHDEALSRDEVLDRIMKRFAMPELVGESPAR